MSHYTDVETEFKDKDCLVKALKDMGYNPEVGQNLPLYGYQGDRRSLTAEIVVRRHEVGSAANDVGFKWDAKAKCFRQIISKYDAGQRRMTTDMIKLAYSPHKVAKLLKQNRFCVTHQKTVNGELKIYARR